MDFNNITIGQVVVALASIGAICAFLFKIFSLFAQVKENKKQIELLATVIQGVKKENEKQKGEILSTLGETNTAVNLLCSAISAMIDSELDDNNNKDELRAIKKELDKKKGIV